jgi:predicted pyridoxine 5'-phosphate oxidase superfamily flavin-nucleotide-binding protein
MDARTALSVFGGSTAERRMQEAAGSAQRAQRFYDTHMLDRLNAKMRDFVARQEMMFLSTADAAGNCDSTFRAGPPGFVVVLDDRRLAWPEYRGNGVMASVGNITDNGHAGLLFVDFFRDIIGLHVNGLARIAADADLRASYPDLPIDAMPGRRPERWVVVDVEEAYVHCRKHIPQLVKRERPRVWGTDDTRSKGGDFFDVAATRDAERATARETERAAVRDAERAAATVSAAVAALAPVAAPPVDAPPEPAARPGWRGRLTRRSRR